MGKKKPRKKSLTSYKKKAWSLCSQYIRRKSADPDGFVACVCCGLRKHWKEQHASHLVPSRRLGILFDERGIKVCCYGCNVKEHGNIHAYIEYMNGEYGRKYTDSLIEELRRNAKKAIKFTSTDYEQIITKYQALLDGMGKT